MNISNTVLKIVTTVSLILVFSLVSPAQEWAEIKLLKSNKEDVEKILGKPVSLENYHSIYETEGNRIGVTYSDGICNYDFPTDFNVPAWTVKIMSITPKKSPIFSTTVDDKKSLSIISNSPPTIIYRDPKKNIVYHIKIRDNVEYLESMVLEPDSNSDLVCLKYEDNCFRRVSITMEPLKESYKRGELAYVVTAIENPRKYEYEFSWSLSEGEIVEGQNKDWVKIDTSKIKKDSFTVKLVIKAKLPDGKFCLKIEETTIKLQN